MSIVRNAEINDGSKSITDAEISRVYSVYRCLTGEAWDDQKKMRLRIPKTKVCCC